MYDSLSPPDHEGYCGDVEPLDTDTEEDSMRTTYRNGDEIGLRYNGCDGCSPATVNGVLCHETGCPDAWRDAEDAPESDYIDSTIEAAAMRFAFGGNAP